MLSRNVVATYQMSCQWAKAHTATSTDMESHVQDILRSGSLPSPGAEPQQAGNA